jgi:hypothetical protein
MQKQSYNRSNTYLSDTSEYCKREVYMDLSSFICTLTTSHFANTHHTSNMLYIRTTDYLVRTVYQAICDSILVLLLVFCAVSDMDIQTTYLFKSDNQWLQKISVSFNHRLYMMYSIVFPPLACCVRPVQCGSTRRSADCGTASTQ